MVKKIWVVIFLFPVLTFAQKKSLNRLDYIETYPNKFQIAPFIEAKSHILDLYIEHTTGSHRLIYVSNFNYVAGVRIKYKSLSFAIGKRLPIHAFEGRLGPSDNFGLGITLVKQKFMIFSRYETYKGFYLSNTEEWLPGFQEKNNAYYHRPDLGTTTWFTGVNYFFNNKRFSGEAALFNLERQKKAALGFVLGANFALNRFGADSSLVPTEGRVLVSDTTSTNLNTLTLGVQAGLAFTIPLFRNKRYYFTTSLIPGYSLQWGKSNNGTVSTNDGSFFNGITNEVRMGFGYNAPKWFSSLTLSSFGNTINISENERFIVQNAYLRFALGLRIGK